MRGATMILFLRNIFFVIILPGSVTVTIPYYFILRRHIVIERFGLAQVAGLIEMTFGSYILFRCVWDFATKGRGTLAPVDPPRTLVVQGLYRYVRNPMYVGVMAMLLGESLFFESTALLRYAMGCFLAFHLFVMLYEEPTLRNKFGESYIRYCSSVNRWLPRL
jgi:protein-S-isoprenylcysteine O-methyltransferase Ste14